MSGIEVIETILGLIASSTITAILATIFWIWLPNRIKK